VEHASRTQLFAKPAHPYTQALFDAVPKIGAGRRKRAALGATLGGNVGSQTERHRGCAFADRCAQVQARCREDAPELRDIGDGHMASCHFV